MLITGCSVKSKGFNYISSSEGLKSSIIRSVIKSSEDLVWIGTLKGLYQFDGYRTNQTLMPNGLPFNYVRSIVEDSQGIVWIGTKDDGIFYLKDGIVHQYNLDHDKGTFQVMIKSDQNLILVFSQSIIEINNLKRIRELKNPIETTIYSVVEYKDNQLMIGTTSDVFLLDLISSELNKLTINSDHENRRKHVLHGDTTGQIWLGRSDGLYEFNETCQCFVNRHDILKGIEVHTLGSDQQSLWIGTNQMGVYHFNTDSNVVKQYTYDKSSPYSINDSAVISVFVSPENDLLLGTFNGGVNFINLNSLKFGAIPGTEYLASCLASEVIYGMYELSQTDILLGTNKGFTQLNLDQESCHHFTSNGSNSNSISGRYVFSFHQNGNEMMLMGSAGIDVMNLLSKEIYQWNDLIPKVPIFFLYETSKDKYIFGTDQGLYFFDSEKQLLNIFKSITDEDLPHRFYHVQETPMGTYFSSTQGLYKLNGETLEYIPVIVDSENKITDMTGLVYDGDQGFLIASDRKYFVHFEPGKGVSDLSYLINESDFNVTVLEIIEDKNGMFWMSSDNGIYQLDLANKQVHRFRDSDGLQSNDFLLISSHKGKSGKLYFGGRNGLNAFYPEDIKINENPPRVVLTEVSQLNKKLNMGQETLGGFVLDKPINHMESIELGYQDLAIGFEFAALDYADSSRNQYAYRLLGFNDEWSYVGADDRKANYTNLSPGNYTFQVKASNKDGVWNPEPKELVIKVYPAPWFSPWAYAAYAFIILLSIWGFIRYKTIASRKRAEELEVTVNERTKEVQLQKKMVESLLDHKNEVFANVTHEFKTPLALIVGPVDQLTEEPELTKFSSQLDMIQRNAKRLLLMVGQILKLSQAEQEKEVIRVPQAVQPTLLMLFESFNPLAKDKEITFSLHNDHEVNVYATADCIETVVGNLISNALKYTQKGGTVAIHSSVNEDQVSISVKDTGPGIKEQDLGKIFKRFTRLDDHQNIQGTGIGLSVVKEVTEANNGYVKVNSEWGSGSEFIVTFPVSHLEVDGTMSRVMTDQLVSNTESELEVDGVAVMPTASSTQHAVTVLVIEDNLDMQKHTGNVLKDRFNCMFADRGEKGIALALKEVPDVIICDVMMPGMDGYQVTRILRHDERTSHIPIILLTALNTKESRIKGWREKIDRYMTKPFDAMELNVQLDSILSLRKLLQEKTNQVITSEGPLEQLDLTKQDLKFIEKLKDVITEYYSNEYFQKADLAAKMAISERQLQRKVKALVGVGPLDMLRDYRLEQAKMKLKDGLQVSQASDECGFSSVSYFGTCFKKKYGITPKQYQQLD